MYCTHFCSWFFLGIVFMAVPQYMSEGLVPKSSTPICWLVAELAKMVGALAGSWLADTAKSWDVVFGSLLLQNAAQFVLVVLTLRPPTTTWVFGLSFSIIFLFGTAEDGIIGPSYMKMLANLETRLCKEAGQDQSQKGERFEEILSLMEFSCALALCFGPLYANSVYVTWGFAMTLLSFTIVSTIVYSC